MTYESLNATFRLRLIKTEEDYVAAKSLWDDYIVDEKNNPRVSSAVILYAEVLSLLMEKYEQEKLAEETEEESEEESDKPEDEDLVTKDYITFFRVNMGGRIAFVVGPSQDWTKLAKAYMEKTRYWPNVWLEEERGGYTNITTEGTYERLLRGLRREA